MDFTRTVTKNTRVENFVIGETCHAHLFDSSWLFMCTYDDNEGKKKIKVQSSCISIVRSIKKQIG